MFRFSAFAVLAFLWSLNFFTEAQTTSFDPILALDHCNVSWSEPGTGSADSMPLGNGDVALNVWTEPSGDLVFYIAKTDAWNEDPASWVGGLMKLGRVRVSVDPPIHSASQRFTQILKLHQAEIDVTEGAPGEQVSFKVWVDANHPVIHVESTSQRAVRLNVALEVWRTQAQKGISADVVVPNQADAVMWYHRDGLNSKPAVVNLTFGGLIVGDHLKNRDASTLVASAPAQRAEVAIYALTAQTSSPEAWQTQLQKVKSEADAIDPAKAWQEHLAWWDDFWHRSWIFCEGDAAAQATTHGYVLQRFVTACAGRGAYPIKFNGSLFVIDNKTVKPDKNSPPGVSADYRTWGGQYWFQNTRAMYWPRLMAGDEDLMLPLFKMYRQELEANAASVQTYYGHGGSYIAETAPFYGGIPKITPTSHAHYTLHYFTPVLELTQMGLDYYDYTGDENFLRKTVLPIATAGLTFFDQHFPRDEAGKLLLDPDNSIEMYWKVHNPLPDLAALHAVLPRLLALPGGTLEATTAAQWRRLLSILPDLPMAKDQTGKTVLLPYTGAQTEKQHNFENPELYAIYPYRLYGLGLPAYQIAADTFAVRLFKTTGCWVQDPIQAAMLGQTDLAQNDVTSNFTDKDPAQKFPAFWANSHDYQPDEDNGGNGENGLQCMLLMPRGKTLYLLPAWPKDWKAHFRLHAPEQTILSGTITRGKISDLVITPQARAADVVVLDDAAKSLLMKK